MMEKNGKVELGKTPSEYSGKPSTNLVKGVPVSGRKETEQVKKASEHVLASAIDLD